MSDKHPIELENAASAFVGSAATDYRNGQFADNTDRVDDLIEHLKHYKQGGALAPLLALALDEIAILRQRVAGGMWIINGWGVR